MREAQSLAHLSHPHIVRVLDFAVQDGTPFLVMEYAPGGTLRTRYPKETRLPLDTIVSYVSQVAAALQYAHDQRLLHRDIKPENMLLSAQNEVLLSDFGLAMLAPSSQSMRTQAIDQSMAGSTPYLAPEQLQGHSQRASDQYALGVVVYEWLCGRRPFRGTPIEVMMQHLSTAPLPLREQVLDLSSAIEEVIMRALAKEPKLRLDPGLCQRFAGCCISFCHSYRTPSLRGGGVSFFSRYLCARAASCRDRDNALRRACCGCHFGRTNAARHSRSHICCAWSSILQTTVEDADLLDTAHRARAGRCCGMYHALASRRAPGYLGGYRWHRQDPTGYSSCYSNAGALC